MRTERDAIDAKLRTVELDSRLRLFEWDGKVTFAQIGVAGIPEGRSIAFLVQTCKLWGKEGCELCEPTTIFPSEGAELYKCGCRVAPIMFGAYACQSDEELAGMLAAAEKAIEGAEPRKSLNGIGWAVKQLQNGSRVRRAGWNGKGMYLILVPGSVFKVNRKPLIDVLPEGTEVNYRPHVDICSIDGAFVPWNASQSDLLAIDWEIVD